MDITKNPSRRKILKTGLAGIAVSSLVSPKADAAPVKAPDFVLRPKGKGETKVVVQMGDYWHPAVSQESHVRGIFRSLKDWKIYYVQRSNFFNEELLKDADLLIVARYGGADSMGFSPDPVVVDRPAGDPWMTEAQEKIIIDNVKNRGMGMLSVHCTIFTGRKNIEDLIGIEQILHQEIQPVIYKDFNQDHPITKGISPFFTNLEEQFDVQIKNPSTTTLLFRSLAVHDKRDSVGGWCLEQGNGRIVGLLPGHYQWTYRLPVYQEVFWRAAHWALKRDIPPFKGGGGY
jgi:type 1 glutamine amidotransferase